MDEPEDYQYYNMDQVVVRALSSVPKGTQAMSSKIIAVVVTFNRVGLLPRCLNALAIQTLPLAEIIVVDNASTDTTQTVLQEQFRDKVTVVRMAYNTGGAGGFHTGVEHALAHGAEWIWLMDDDGFANPDTLARLIERSDTLDVINPLVCLPNERNLLSFGLRVGGGLTRHAPAVRAASLEDGILPNEINPFNGTLIRAETILKHGNIRPEMFIWGDEVEFVLRVLHEGARVGTVTTAFFNHPENQRKTVQLGSFGALTECPANFSRFFYRNSGFYTWRYRGAGQAVAKFGAYTIFFLLRGQLLELGKFWMYYFDGLTNGFLLPPSRTALLSRVRVILS
jgi:rhamnopyranosyl-N-acetylglucosaminyl-diphospho-decaprenol beta-1,3/1,4-galactofuranosyltransferase